MCGIAGILSTDGAPDPGGVEAMIARLAHRGPDGRGTHVDGPVALGHARLSLVDLAGGAQPMCSPDGDLAITFNGEIFNHVELRRELERDYDFRTRSDTEVILAAYARFGADCVEHLNGQWAFALWDRRRRTLLLSRDRMGIRPLFYAAHHRRFAFASEVKALFADAELSRALSATSLFDTMAYWTPALSQATPFEGVCSVPPGTSLLVDENGAFTEHRYWRPSFDIDEDMAYASAVEELRALLDDATRIRLRADVPVGAYLSGGLDSSITTALARVHAGERLSTYSLTFADAAYDEAGYQTEVAAALGITHHPVLCRREDIARVFPRAVYHAEAPLFRTAPAPLFLLSQAVHEAGTKAVLTGEGADEVFAGYDIFREAKLRRLLAEHPGSPRYAALFRRLYPYLSDVQRQSPAYLEAFFHAGPRDLEDACFSHLPRWTVSSFAHRFLSDDILAAAEPTRSRERLESSLPPDFGLRSPLVRAQTLEMTMLLPGYLLSSQGDRMSMGHSVEGRYPFLDHRVVELAGRMPERFKLLALDEKRILKDAFGDRVPASVRRRKKQPYRAPESEAFFTDGVLTPFAAELLSTRRIAQAGVFRPTAVEKLVQKAQTRGLTTFRENLAFVAILSTQLLVRDMLERGGEPLSDVESSGTEDGNDDRQL